MSSIRSKKVFFAVGDVTEAKEDYICHQTNCTSRGSKGVAAAIFKKFPSANTYTKRRENSYPGTIDINGKIINLNAQVYPGPPTESSDSKAARLTYFARCLNEIVDSVPLGSSFAFPFMVGCGLGGGDWNDYLALIEQFSLNTRVTKVVFYQTLF